MCVTDQPTITRYIFGMLPLFVEIFVVLVIAG
jgi:hypothetical protein